MVNYFKNFPITGLMKLAFGVFFVAIGIKDKETYISVLGAILIAITLLNKGTCPGNACSSNLHSRKVNK